MAHKMLEHRAGEDEVELSAGEVLREAVSVAHHVHIGARQVVEPGVLHIGQVLLPERARHHQPRADFQHLQPWPVDVLLQPGPDDAVPAEGRRSRTSFRHQDVVQIRAGPAQLQSTDHVTGLLQLPLQPQALFMGPLLAFLTRLHLQAQIRQLLGQASQTWHPFQYFLQHLSSKPVRPHRASLVPVKALPAHADAPRHSAPGR